MPESGKRPTPCPFCRRPLDLSGRGSGKIGCRSCGNVFFYNALTGTVSPLAKTEAAGKKTSTPLPGATRLFLTHPLPILLVGSCFALLLCLLAWLLFKPAPLPPDAPEAIVNEAERELKSLAE